MDFTEREKVNVTNDELIQPSTDHRLQIPRRLAAATVILSMVDLSRSTKRDYAK